MEHGSNTVEIKKTTYSRSSFYPCISVFHPWLFFLGKLALNRFALITGKACLAVLPIIAPTPLPTHPVLPIIPKSSIAAIITTCPDLGLLPISDGIPLMEVGIR
jgi:hypothetical protein